VNRNCKSWNGSACGLGFYGGKPSPGVCRQCNRRKPRIQGLGDAVERVTELTGIKSVVDKVSKITGRDCGCGKRKEALNKLVPFKQEAEADELQSNEN